MNDFLMWFITKHWFVASALFPEVVFAWAVWMKYTAWACGMVFYITVVRGAPIAVQIFKWIQGRE